MYCMVLLQQFECINDACCFIKILRAETEWAEEQQKKLRTRIKETAGLNLRTYKVTHEVCGRIKQVCVKDHHDH